MSGSLVNTYTINNVHLTSMMNTLTYLNKGHFALSVTNFTTTTVPQIAAGSIIEVDGALFVFNSLESISGNPDDGIVYAKLVPNAAEITAEWTTTAPTWSDSKQGWYGTEGSANHRYFLACVKAGAVYNGKYYFNDTNGFNPLLTITQTNAIGAWNTGTEKSITVTFPFIVGSLLSFSFIIHPNTAGMYLSNGQKAFISGLSIYGTTITITFKNDSAINTSGASIYTVTTAQAA